MALILFDEYQRSLTSNSLRDAWKADFERRSQLAGAFCSAGPRQDVEQEALIDRQLMIENWEHGIVPRSIRDAIPFIYAKAFLYALDRIGKFLAVLTGRADLPGDAIAACRQYYVSFPTLQEVRNSTQHIEDRGRGLGKGGKPLKLQPVDAGGISAPNGALILDNLAGNRFGTTMADGHFGEVEVSAATLAKVRDNIESVMNALPWSGPVQHYPT